MYLEKLSLSNIKDVISKIFDNKVVKIKKIDVKTVGTSAGISSISVGFEVLNGKYKSEGYKPASITLTDYYAVLNEFDEVEYGFDEKFVKKYHKAMIEEFEKIEARKAKKENLADRYKKDVDYSPAESEEDVNVL